LVKNLRTATENMRAVIAGLNRVAANYRNVEQANLLLPENVDLPEIRVGEANVENYVLAAGLYWCKVGLIAMLTKGVSELCARLAFSAGVAVSLWIGFMPDDVALNRAHAQWLEAAKQLDKFDKDLIDKVSALNKTWSQSEAQEVFTRWISKFAEEVDECKAAVVTGADSITSLIGTLNLEARLAWVSAVGNLLVLAAMEVLGWSFPPSRPVWRVLMEIVGAILSINTDNRIAYATAAVKTVLLAIKSVMEVTFVTKKEQGKLGGNGIDFEEVALSDEQIDVLVRDAIS